MNSTCRFQQETLRQIHAGLFSAREWPLSTWNNHTFSGNKRLYVTCSKQGLVL